MKKLWFLLPAAALALASCSSDDTVASKSTPSATDALIVRPSIQGATRTVAITNSNFSEFRLIANGKFSSAAPDGTTAADILSINTVLTQAGNWAFGTGTTPTTPASAPYWYDKNTTAYFKAFYPTDLADGAEYTANTDRAQQKDVVVAYNEGVKADFTAGVPLNFRHVLSQVVFKAVNKSADKVNISIKNVRLMNINSTAKLALPTVITTAEAFSWDKYTPWSNFSAAEKYLGTEAANNSEIQLFDREMDVTFGDPFFLIPQQLEKGDITKIDATAKQYVSFLIKCTSTATTLPSEDDKKAAWKLTFPRIAEPTNWSSISSVADLAAPGYTWAAIPLDTKWEPGKKYIYTINYSEFGLGTEDPNQDDGGTNSPGTEPGDDIVPDSPLQLSFDINVVDWEETTVPQNL